MPVSINNTTLTFNDGTTQTTAASASSYVGGRGQVFTSNGTFTIPTGITALRITVVGGGGGGGGGSSTAGPAGTGGGGAGTAISFLTGLTPGNTLSVTVGGAGSGGASYANGSSGGNSTVASGTQTITTITGGGGAGGGYAGGSLGSGGTASNGTFNINGSNGVFPTNAGLPFCPPYYFVNAGAGGNSMFGAGGAGRSDINNAFSGVAGSGRGAGGSGAYSSGTAGSGSAGFVMIEW